MSHSKVLGDCKDVKEMQYPKIPTAPLKIKLQSLL